MFLFGGTPTLLSIWPQSSGNYNTYNTYNLLHLSSSSVNNRPWPAWHITSRLLCVWVCACVGVHAFVGLWCVYTVHQWSVCVSMEVKGSLSLSLPTMSDGSFRLTWFKLSKPRSAYSLNVKPTWLSRQIYIDASQPLHATPAGPVFTSSPLIVWLLVYISLRFYIFLDS